LDVWYSILDKWCTLSEASHKSLIVYKVNILRTELKCINEEYKYYKLKKDDMRNVELMHYEQSCGYSYIFSKVCYHIVITWPDLLIKSLSEVLQNMIFLQHYLVMSFHIYTFVYSIFLIYHQNILL